MGPFLLPPHWMRNRATGCDAMRRRNGSLAAVLSVMMFACAEYGLNVCEYCEYDNPLKTCRSGLECVDHVCVRPDGNLIGECCGHGPRECDDAYYCVYRTCEASPIYPPPKEQVETPSASFQLSPGTRIVLPASPVPTDETAGQALQSQIEGSYGIEVSVQPYTDGVSLENAIILGTASSNPAVQTLVGQLGLEVPDQGPRPSENYAFAVTSHQILVAGLGNAGVLYGAQALKQFIRGRAEKDPSGALEETVVRDYPDVEMRMHVLLLMFYHVPSDLDGDGYRDPYKYTDIPVDLEVARQYIRYLSEFRFNTVLFSLADIVTWANLPEPQNTAISVSELMDLVTEANAYGLEVIPFLTGSSSSHGWIGTAAEPVEYSPAYSIAHDEEHLLIYKSLLQEIVDAFAAVQPLRYFHMAMDEDTTFGPRTLDRHRQWVNESYDVLASNGVKTIIWHDIWTKTDDYVYSYSNYPDMQVAVWDYHTFIPESTFDTIEGVVDRGLEVSQAFLGNGGSKDFDRWFADFSPLQKGFIGVYWTTQGTTCREKSLEYLLHTYLREYARQFWNARTY
jgi:Glycosyl hydrolase family 20, domain 2